MEKNKDKHGEVMYYMFNTSKKMIKEDPHNTFNDIDVYKDKMSEEDFNLFKAFCLGYTVIDLHTKVPHMIVLTKRASDLLDKEEEERKKEECSPSIDDLFDIDVIDVEKELKDLMDAFKRLK